MRINELIIKYFEGETTCEEEREIKHFFKEEEVPEELELYRPFFTFFEEETNSLLEAKRENSNNTAEHSKTPKPKRYLIYTLGSIAAGLLIILSITGINKQVDHLPANYVIIDGHQSADIHLAREQAQAAFDEVSFSREEIFETLFNE